MLELAGNLPPRRSSGYPIVVSAAVRPNPPDRVHGLTRCEPTPAPNPRVELTLTRSTALPNQMSESEMGLTLPESSALTRRAGRPNPTQRLEMSPTRVVGKPPFMVTEQPNPLGREHGLTS